jgi:hypothetical protein
MLICMRSAPLRAGLRRKEKARLLQYPALTRQHMRKIAHMLSRRTGLLSAIPFGDWSFDGLHCRSGFHPLGCALGRPMQHLRTGCAGLNNSAPSGVNRLIERVFNRRSFWRGHDFFGRCCVRSNTLRVRVDSSAGSYGLRLPEELWRLW